LRFDDALADLNIRRRSRVCWFNTPDCRAAAHTPHLLPALCVCSPCPFIPPKTYQNSHQLLTHSRLRCRTSIIRPSALTWAPSSWSMASPRCSPRTIPITEFCFRHFFVGGSCFCIEGFSTPTSLNIQSGPKISSGISTSCIRRRKLSRYKSVRILAIHTVCVNLTVYLCMRIYANLHAHTHAHTQLHRWFLLLEQQSMHA